ncbi:MAG: glutamate--cysteine ligase [Bdellovibrionaceae bacterium]|nr:glutamate--cysteine ligase [Pseudobdellovibrionaceae bacterium]
MNSNPLSFHIQIHQKIIDNLKVLENWFLKKINSQKLPFYSSFDIRDSNFKIACVDANLFPAGFNNICEEDQKRTSFLIKDYLKKYYPSVKKIMLLAEEHTRNLYYWDNIFVIKSLIEKAGAIVTVGVPGKKITSTQKITSASGRKVDLKILNQSKSDLIISNNDFSVKYELPKDIECAPPFFMGWLHRKKHRFFKEYNSLTKEFAEILKIDSWHFTIETKLFSPFDLQSQDNLSKLKSASHKVLESLKKSYQNFSVKEKPYLFLKNNSGTYGMGIINIHESEELNHWSYKSRKKMKASKGETNIKELIIQEGIPTALLSKDNKSSEPVIYMIGSQVAGGFLRSHKTKGHKTNLNSPGLVFKRLCMSDLEIKMKGLAMENVYSWLAKIGSLALLQEMKNYKSLNS